MSMSSLSAQLASINASATGGKNPGSSLGTSKKHEDAIGRGISHSATHGHVLASKSPLFKPSVIYADSKAASDVPLTTLRENCVSSLRQLAKMTENDAFVRPQILNSLVGTHSLSYERGLSTRSENDKLDDMIVELLSLVSTSMGESSSLSFSSSLHVIEYLLRRYDIHARTNTAEKLILATLPHHEQPVFLRVLQLVDLASMPTWVFLRPYAAKGSPPPTRTAVAKAAARDNALLVHCCEMAKSTAKVHSNEIGKAPSERPSRRGVSRIISFAAAVIMEGLPMQALNPNNNGSVSEPTLRCLLPFVLSACGDGNGKNKDEDKFSLGVVCPDWRGFGHVLAVAITERCVLSEDARQVLATTVVKGLLETDKALRNMEVDENSRIELTADSTLVLMSVLSQNPVSDSEVNKKDGNCENQYLSIIRSSASKDKRAGRVGYNMPNATFRALTKHVFLVKAIAHLYSNRDISVASIMASLVSAALSKLVKDQSSKKKQNISSSCLDLILAVVREKELAPAWKDKKVNLASSFAAALLTKFAKFDHYADSVPEDITRAFVLILDELKAVDPSGCDAGIAYAVTAVCGQKKKKASAIRSSRKKRISLLLGIPSSSSDVGSSIECSETADKSELSTAHLLPPRVALEHPDVAIRIGAIERAMKEEMETESRKGESLEHALLRRMNVDDDAKVVAAAGVAIQKILSERQVVDPMSFGDMALSTVYKWCIFKDEVIDDSALHLNEKSPDKKKKKKKQKESQSTKLSDDKIGALESALHVSAYAAKSLVKDGYNASLPLLRSLVQAIVAHFDLNSVGDTRNHDAVARIVDAASNALFTAVDSSKKSKSSYEYAKTLLTSNGLCSQILKECCSATNEPTSDSRPAKLSIERRYCFVILAVFLEALGAQKESTNIYEEVLAISMETISTFPKGKQGKIKDNESELLVRCLELAGQGLAQGNNGKIPDVILSLVSVSSSDVYDQVCSKAVPTMCDAMKTSTGTKVSPISVLMECATRFNVSVDAIERLVSLASKYVPREAHDLSPGSIYGVVPALMLLASTDQRVRKAALDFIANIGQDVSGVENDSLILKNLYDLASSDKESSGVHSSILMDGATSLPKFLNIALQDSGEDASDLRRRLVRQCLFTACAYGDALKENEEDLSNCWLPFGHAMGGCRAASIVLNAMELAGESTFPLALRWEFAGKEIFDRMAGFKGTIRNEQILSACQILLDAVVRMPKGVLVYDSSTVNRDISNVMISTGPSHRGTRKRSYSLGNADGVSFVDPYPENMLSSILQIITTSSELEGESNQLSVELCEAVVRNVLGSRSWSDGVFNKLPNESRREIASSLLKLRSLRNLESAGLALLGLPLNASDIHKLLEDQQKESGNLVAITFLADWIRTNSLRLAHDTRLVDLSTSLYSLLSILSEAPGEDAMETDDSDASEFARLCILQTLLTLAQVLDAGNKTKKKSRKEQKETTNIVNLLVGLIGDKDERSDTKSSLRPLLSGRAKSTALSLLTNLCSQQPNIVVGSLIPALLTSILSPKDNGGPACISSTASGALLAVVPVYCEHAKSAKLSLFDLLTAIINESNKISDEKLKLQLFSYLVDAFESVTSLEEKRTQIGSLIAAFVASEISTPKGGKKKSRNTVQDGVVSFALNILAHASATVQVACLLQLLQCVHHFTTTLSESEKTGAKKSTDFTEIEDLVLHRSIGTGRDEKQKIRFEYSEDERTNVILFTECLLSVVMDALSIGPIRKLIQKSEGSASAICLQLWQELLHVQAIAADAQTTGVDAEKAFWRSSKSTIDETLEYLQNLLPAHLFLASATSLIRDKNADVELRGKAVRLLAERASDVDPKSAEALLFLDMVPVLLELLDGEVSVVTTQSAMVAIEHIARSLCLPTSEDKDTSVFFTALEKGTRILKQRAPDSMDDDVSTQVVCSVALCASTLVRVLKAKCLPLLKNLVGPLLESLASANTLLADSVSNQDMLKSCKMLQLSIIRTITAIADTLPQFLVPYLGQLLSPLGLPSPSLHLDEADQDENVKAAADRLEEILSKRTPARQLIPAVCKASVACRGKCAESSTLLTILKLSIQSSSRAELATLRSWVLKTVVSAYEYEGKEEEQQMLLAAANQMMLSLVLKLSEAQLRPLYSKLREWKSASGISNANSRRLAFWSLSSVLSKELRVIFLPCLSTVVTDAVEELELAVSTLRDLKESERTAGGKKKRRLTSTSDAKDSVDRSDSLRPLQPLLLCLEAALKADAHDGGNWVRVDDGQRFNSILEPLGKLLQCKIPVNFPVAAAHKPSKAAVLTPFQRVVQGVASEEDGNVVSCLTALASAAGNEQLWKPLNHLVLQACENETRSEVRKAGVKCLLSLIKTLGEEYMVLLPECLPILSELLEETDEEIAALAQECVSLGEDLLGESLQDSLR